MIASSPLSLTTAELSELNRKIKSPTGRRILWEVSRLRRTALIADQLERSRYGRSCVHGCL